MRKLPLRAKLLFLLAILMLILIGLFSELEVRVLAGLTLVMVVCYLLAIAEGERSRKEETESELTKLKSAYDELDGQAKIIIKTDLELTRTKEELDKKIDGLYTLHELGKTIRTTFNEDELFTFITEPLIFKLGFEKGIIFLAEEESKEILCKTAVGYKPEELKDIKSEIVGKGIADRILKENKTRLISSLEEAESEEKSLAKILKVSSYIITPIVTREVAIGFIFIGNSLPYTKLTEGDMEVLFILSSEIAIAVENARLYRQIWKSHQQLEIKVKERTKDLARANEELKKLNKMKSDFVSAVSHELRTPLTSIKGYSCILIDEKLGKLTPAQKERLAKINKHSDSLTNLINGLLDISRIESGRIDMEIKQLAIKDVIDGVIDILNPQLEEKKLVLKVKTFPEITYIRADRSQLERVFINLLGNAIKFTPDKGKITITISVEGDYIRTDISDTGIGIASADLPKIFDEFYRTDNPVNIKRKGTGLGLSLVKRIIEVHQGKIWVKSELNKGTTVSFTIPK